MRRSCETAPIRARRQRSISSSSRVRRACSRSWARSTASAAWLANVPEQAPIPAGELHVLEHEHARRAGCSRPAPRDTRRGASLVDQSQRSGLARAGGQATRFLLGERLAGGRGHVQQPLTGRLAVARAAREPSSAGRRRPAPCRRCASSSCDRVRSPIRAWDSSYSRSDSRSAGAASSRALRSLATTWETISTTTTIDDQGDPVLRRADRQGVVGREEEEVVEEEAPDAPTTPGTKPPTTTPISAGSTNTNAGRAMLR